MFQLFFGSDIACKRMICVLIDFQLDSISIRSEKIQTLYELFQYTVIFNATLSLSIRLHDVLAESSCKSKHQTILFVTLDISYVLLAAPNLMD